MILGQVSLWRHPHWRDTLFHLSLNCDSIQVRVQTSEPQCLNPSDDEIKSACGDVPVTILRSATGPHQWAWREELLRMADNVRPGIILSLDEDEVFGEGFDEDLQAFTQSNFNMAMFAYDWPMPSVDDRHNVIPNCYPVSRHCKMFKWRPDLTFKDYKGFARPTNLVNSNEDVSGRSTTAFVAQSRIQHHCFYDDECCMIRSGQFEKFLAANQRRRLSIGGRNKTRGIVVIDPSPKTRADFNVEVPPLPAAVKSVQWDEVSLIHTFEHMTKEAGEELIRELLPVMAPDGVVEIEVPNIAVCAAAILGQHDQLKQAQGLLGVFGDQRRFEDEPLMLHRWGYTPETLSLLLKRVGFTRVKVVPAKHHSPVRDFRIEASP